MITKSLEDQIIAKIEEGGVSEDGKLEIDSVIAFVVDSPAYLARKPGMPAGNFEHKGVQYAVYFQ